MILNKQKLLERTRTIGTDPEVFVFDEKGLMPAFTFLPHKDSAPLQDGYKLFWDGFQAEWNFDRGFNDIFSMTEKLQKAMASLLAEAKKNSPNAFLSLQNVVNIDPKSLQELPDHFVMLGCMPSYNIYMKRGLHVKDCRKLIPRFAGGHMIFGLSQTKPNYEPIIKTLDKIVGVWAVGAARYIDNPVRRQYYGLAGEFRTPKFGKNFGVEYRTLSNFWLASPEVTLTAWNLARQTVSLGLSRYANLWAAEEDEVQETINNCDVQRAQAILERNKEMFRWLTKEHFDNTFKLFYDGVNNFNLRETWGL